MAAQHAAAPTRLRLVFAPFIAHIHTPPTRFGDNSNKADAVADDSGPAN